MRIDLFKRGWIGSFPYPVVVPVKPKVVDHVQIGNLIPMKKLDCCQLVLFEVCLAIAVQQVIEVLVFSSHDLSTGGGLGNVEEEIGVIIPDWDEINRCTLESLEDFLFNVGRTKDTTAQLRDRATSGHNK
jgi:hypothetical protein